MPETLQANREAAEPTDVLTRMSYVALIAATVEVDLRVAPAGGGYTC